MASVPTGPKWLIFWGLQYICCAPHYVVLHSGSFFGATNFQMAGLAFRRINQGQITWAGLTVFESQVKYSQTCLIWNKNFLLECIGNISSYGKCSNTGYSNNGAISHRGGSFICDNLGSLSNPRVFHENKKLEFHLLLFTTSDPWSKYGPMVNCGEKQQTFCSHKTP